MAFGLKNAPAQYQRIMNEVLQGLDEFCMVYQDDIVIFSKSFTDHQKHLEKVLSRLRKANITLKKSKCKFGVQETRFLGHIITTEGIKMNPDKVKIAEQFPTPKTRKQLKQFLGVIQFYHHFIAKLGELAGPLYELCSTKRTFRWGSAQEEAFRKLKQAIGVNLVLKYPDFSKPFILRTDASETGVGACLSQKDKYGNEKIISFASKKLNSTLQNYATVEKEAYAIIYALDKFYEYLDGHEFTLETDNQALTYLYKMRNTSQRLTRWAWKINEFSPIINHIKGVDNALADYLSRNPLPDDSYKEREVSYMYPPNSHMCNLSMICPITFETLEKEQLTDPYISNLRKSLPQDYLIHNGLVCKSFADKYLPVAPSSLVPMILEELHHSPCSGHLGVTKTYRKCKQRFTFPKMKKTIETYIRSCLKCQQVRYPNQKPPGLMSSPSSSAPWSTLYLDLMGPYTKAHPGGYTLILVIIDYFTKWTEIWPLRTGTSKEITNTLESKIFCRYGLPKRIVTDNAKNLTSNCFERCLLQWQIEHFCIPIYTPQINLTERSNRTIKQIIRTFLLNETHSKWATYLPLVQFAINSSFQESTKFSPAKLFLNREFNLPIDNALKLTPEVTNQSVSIRQDMYSKILKSVTENIRAAQSKQKLYYDARHTPMSMAVGDRVLMKDVQLSSKLQGVSSGLNPLYKNDVYTVSKVIGNNTFMVTNESGKPRGPVHISFLRKFHPPTDPEILPLLTTSENSNLNLLDPVKDSTTSVDNCPASINIDKCFIDSSTKTHYTHTQSNNSESHVTSLPISIPLSTLAQDVGSLNTANISTSPNLSGPNPDEDVPVSKRTRQKPRLDYLKIAKGQGTHVKIESLVVDNLACH